MENQYNMTAFKIIKIYKFNTYIIIALLLLAQTNGHVINKRAEKHCSERVYPFMVLVKQDGADRCVATLLNMGWILSTFRCASLSATVYASDVSSINNELLCDTYTWGPLRSPYNTAQKTKILRLYQYEKYDNFNNNIALAELKNRFKLTAEIVPVVLAPPEMNMNQEIKVDIIRFNFGGHYPDTKCTTYKLLADSVCKEILLDDQGQTLAANHFCILPSGYLSRFAPSTEDKGTPVMCGKYQCAILIDLLDIGYKEYLSLYIWVDEFYDWIKNKTTIETELKPVTEVPQSFRSNASWFCNSLLLLLPFCMSIHISYLLLSMFA